MCCFRVKVAGPSCRLSEQMHFARPRRTTSTGLLRAGGLGRARALAIALACGTLILLASALVATATRADGGKRFEGRVDGVGVVESSTRTLASASPESPTTRIAPSVPRGGSPRSDALATARGLERAAVVKAVAAGTACSGPGRRGARGMCAARGRRVAAPAGRRGARQVVGPPSAGAPVGARQHPPGAGRPPRRAEGAVGPRPETPGGAAAGGYLPARARARPTARRPRAAAHRAANRRRATATRPALAVSEAVAPGCCSTRRCPCAPARRTDSSSPRRRFVPCRARASHLPATPPDQAPP